MDLIVIPTYDEAENITPLLDAVAADHALAGVHVLVVDDDSPDGTAARVRSHPLFGERAFLLSRPARSGLGPAYRAGFAWAHQHGYERVVQMDADGSHPLDRVPALLEAVRRADVVIGSRYVTGGRTVDWPWRRRLVSRVGNGYVRAVLGLDVHDATAGFRAYRTSALARSVARAGEAHGYAFQVETTWRAARSGLVVTEVPITFADRRRGISKMSPAIVVEAMWRVLRWRFDESRERAVAAPQRVG